MKKNSRQQQTKQQQSNGWKPGQRWRLPAAIGLESRQTRLAPLPQPALDSDLPSHGSPETPVSRQVRVKAQF